MWKSSKDLGLFLKALLKEKSLSMRGFSKLTGIDAATISRIMNGKRNATPGHLSKMAECLDVPVSELFIAAGYPIERIRDTGDIHSSIDDIQALLKTSYDQEFSIKKVEELLSCYEEEAVTEEGKNSILTRFEGKLYQVGGMGPFISQLQNMYQTYILKKVGQRQLVLIGSALLYFILPVDVIPDYIFPLGYIDDAIAVQVVTAKL